MRLVQLVPTLGPPVEGVGAHARCLAAHLGRDEGVRVELVVGTPLGTGGPRRTEAGAPVRAVAERSGPALAAALAGADADAPEGDRPTTVLVHYSNYGYQARGCPFWLAAGVESWRRGGPRRRLVTLFHEVYATGAPWTSSFWLSPAQRRIAARIARVSDALMTSLERYAGLLERLGAPTEPFVAPVFSTVGEPAEAPPLHRRARRGVVFGGSGIRSRAYGADRGALEAACRRLELEELLDVGPPLAAPPGTVAGRPVRGLGVLPSEEVGELLAGSAVGLISYPPAFLSKSTVFAAYSAHGMLPVCLWGRRSGAEAAGPEPRWWSPPAAGGEGSVPDAAARQAIATRALAWYRGHSLERQAARLRTLLAAGAQEGAP